MVQDILYILLFIFIVWQCFRAMKSKEFGMIPMNLAFALVLLMLPDLPTQILVVGEESVPPVLTDYKQIEKNMGWTVDLTDWIPDGDQTPWSKKWAKSLIINGAEFHSYYLLAVMVVFIVTYIVAVFKQNPSPLLLPLAMLIGWFVTPRIVAAGIEGVFATLPDNFVLSTLVQYNTTLIFSLLFNGTLGYGGFSLLVILTMPFTFKFANNLTKQLNSQMEDFVTGSPPDPVAPGSQPDVVIGPVDVNAAAPADVDDASSKGPVTLDGQSSPASASASANSSPIWNTLLGAGLLSGLLHNSTDKPANNGGGGNGGIPTEPKEGVYTHSGSVVTPAPRDGDIPVTEVLYYTPDGRVYRHDAVTQTYIPVNNPSYPNPDMKVLTDDLSVAAPDADLDGNVGEVGVPPVEVQPKVQNVTEKQFSYGNDEVLPKMYWAKEAGPGYFAGQLLIPDLETDDGIKVGELTVPWDKLEFDIEETGEGRVVNDAAGTVLPMELVNDPDFVEAV
jgi:hypothetical protein